jgi:peptidyl-prolyl cis-trans isomerase SurA
MPRCARLGLLLLVLAPSARGEEALVDGIAAQVGSEIVLVSEVAELVGPTEAAAREQGVGEAQLAQIRAEGLEQLIERRLLAKVAQDSDLQASDADVDKAIEAIASDNGLSLEQLRASLDSHGIGWSDYRLRIKSEVERQKVVQAMVGSQVSVDEQELRALYAETYAAQPMGGEAVHVRQLLVLGGEGTPRDLASACGLTRGAAGRIAKGESFEALARELSAAAPEHGGDIGWIHVDTMAEWMKQAVSGLEPGGVSPVIELPFGCTLISVVERKAYEPVDFEQAKATLQQEVYQRKLMEKYREWMENLRKRIFIERRGYFASGGTAQAPPAAGAAAASGTPGSDAFTLTP